MNQPRSTGRIVRAFAAVTVLAALAIPSSGAADASARPTRASRATASPTASLWHPESGVRPSALVGADIAPTQFSAFTLDRAGMLAALKPVPLQHFGVAAPATPPVVLSLPTPTGAYQRFAVTESPVMMPALARRHPHIKTYDGHGIDDPTANIRFAMTPLGFNASVRSEQGMWYVDTANHLSQSLYVVYYGADLPNTHGRFVEMEGRAVRRSVERAASVDPLTNLTVGSQLRTYRLALVSDPSYATYWGAANVTTGKVLLVNRIDQVYESELAIHMDLAANNDLLNLNTDALATGTNGPCGAAACYGPTDFADCTSDPNRLVMGLTVGAGNYDIGHMISGLPGGGLSSLGVVGTSGKAESCTGLEDPIGDEYAVGYVSHEMGHEFNADHTWNGTAGSCSSDQRAQADSVEPGSGSTIMSYAGICGSDNIQNPTDPYFSQKSFEEITDYVTGSQSANNEVQTAALTGFGGSDSFRLRYNGQDSALITNGSNYTAAGIKAAIQGIPGWPAGGTVTVAGYSGSGSPNSSGFQVTFNGTLGLSPNVGPLSFSSPTGFTGVIGSIIKGGPTTNGGFTVTATGNHPPVVTAPSSFTIPYRTPFSLTGSATDADGDPVTYLWEQNDAGATNGTALRSNFKPNGPLFRIFGSAPTGVYNPTISPSGGTNVVTTNPTRVFPDMAQIAVNNTDADTGTCPAGNVECFSEFLPINLDYVGAMHFRLTARDGHPGAGGVSSADTTVSLAPGTGPFQVTSPNTAVSYGGSSGQTVTWNVAGTSVAPISASNVSISLSSDGGLTFPVTLLTSTPNDGSQAVTLPDNINTTQARIKVQAVGNVFFDISNANFTIVPDSNQQTITFNALPDKTFGDPDFTVAATAFSGLAVSYGATGNCTASGSTVHLTGGGSCTIAANQAGDAFWQAAPEVDRTFTINKANQTINFSGLPDKGGDDPDFGVSATASSGLAVAFSSTTPPVCTVSGSTVHLVGGGTCSITASQAGNSSYNAATPITQSFSVGTVTQTITFNPLPNKTWGDPDFQVSATASSGLTVSFAANGPCTVTGSTVHLTGTGTCTMTASQAGGGVFHAAPNVQQSFSIARANQSITFDSIPDHAANDADFSVSATASSGLAVSFTAAGNCTVTGNGSVLHLSGAGSCTITAHQPGNSNFFAATDVGRTFNIAQASQSIAFAAIPDHALNDPSFSVSASASSGLAVSFTAVGNCTVTPDGSVVTLVAMGSCTITAHQAGDANYTAAADVARTFNITAVLKATTTTFALKAAKVKHGGRFKATVTVKGVGTAVKPTGTANLLIDGVVVGTGTLGATGKVTISVVATQSVGTHSMTAVYGGSATFSTSTSAPKTVHVT